MVTINISLPEKLKSQAQELISKGYYASFSDLVRDSLRQVVSKSKYDLMADEAEKDMRKGRGVIMRSDKDIDEFMNSL